MTPSPPHSLAEQVYRRTRADILAGRLPPGSKVTVRELADRHRVSTMPARDAIQRLKQESLLVDHRRATTVVTLTKAELRELFEIRLHLESLAARWALPALTDGDLADLRSAYRAMSAPGMTAPRWRPLNRAFHERFYASGPSQYLVDLVRNTWDRIEPYMAVYAAAVHDFDHAQHQHARLLDRIEARDLDGLLRETADHLEHTADAIVAALDDGHHTPPEERMTYEELTVDDFHRRLDEGTLTSARLTAWYLDRIERLDASGPGLGSVVTLNPGALAEAERLDAELARTGRHVGPLHGVPVLLKDQAETAGIPTAFGSALFADYVPDRDATVVTRLREAGAVVLGKTTMCDFAAGWFSFSSRSDHTKNPYDLDRETGGSSAGTAAAVTANLCLVGIGEDTGGSIRLPASFTNLFGLRVTTGLVPRTGFSPLLHFQDTPGPLARTVGDLAAVLDVVVGFDPDDEMTALATTTPDAGHYRAALSDVEVATLGDYRVGVLTDAFGTGADQELTNTVVREAIAALGENGTTVAGDVVLGDLSDWVEGTSLYTTQSRHDITAFLAQRPGAPLHSFEEIAETGTWHPLTDLMQGIADGPATVDDDPEYHAKRERQTTWRQRLLALMASADVDFLVYPTVQVPAPTRAELAEGRWNALDFPTNTVIGSQTSLPAISVPAGFTPDGLPVGLEILGKPLAEKDLLRFARAWELATAPRRPATLPTAAGQA